MKERQKEPSQQKNPHKLGMILLMAVLIIVMLVSLWNILGYLLEGRKSEKFAQDLQESAIIIEKDNTDSKDTKKEKEEKEEKEEPAGIQVIVNKEPIFMSGKAEYIYVDVFDYIEFNLNDSRGRNIVTHLNGQNTEYTAPLKDGDVVDIYWEENN